METNNLKNLVAQFELRKGMYFYRPIISGGLISFFHCEYCGVRTDSLLESSVDTPKTCCLSCQVLLNLGALTKSDEYTRQKLSL